MKGNETKSGINFSNWMMLGGMSLGGFVFFSMTLYIAWKCWLKEKIEELCKQHKNKFEGGEQECKDITSNIY